MPDIIASRLAYEKTIEDALAEILGLATGLAAYKGTGDTRLTLPRLDVVVDSIDQRAGDFGDLALVATPRGNEYLSQTANLSLVVVVQYEATGDRETALNYAGQVRAEMLLNSGNFVPGVFPGLTLVDIRPAGSSRETSEGRHEIRLDYAIDFDTDPGDWPEV
jgi:hypothetical protein